MPENAGVPDVDLDDRAAPVAPTPTGHDDVDALLTELEGLRGTPVAEHVAVFERLHLGLRGVLDASTAG
ncbi:hypothetical protein [Nocardioides zeae]